MEITDKDDDKAKSKKKKLQKSWKSQQRFAKLDAETQKRQQSWMDFKKGKGSKKKVALVSCLFHVPFQLSTSLSGQHRLAIHAPSLGQIVFKSVLQLLLS